MPRQTKTPDDLRMYYLQRSPPAIDGVRNLQTYFPSMETLFPSIQDQVTGSPTLAARELAVSVDISHGLSVVEDLHTHEVRVTPTWIRKMHLLEPVEVLSGQYILHPDGALPSFRAVWQRTLRKLNDPFNEAYTDAVCACLASRLVETGRSPHFVRFYGTVNGRIPEYSYNFTDDIGSAEGEAWYREGLASGAFRVVAADPYDPTVTTEVTRPWEDVRRRLFGTAGSEEDSVSSPTSEHSDSENESDSDKKDAADGAVDNEDDDQDNEDNDDELVEADIEVSGEAVVRRPLIRLSRVSGDNEGGDNGEENRSRRSTGSEDEIDYKLLVKDFPTQMTVLERCDGTMDDLMEDEIADDATEDMRETKEGRWTAWMFQVVAALTAAQQHFDLIHNDLHTNNVMWSGTGETHLYYHVTGAAGGDRFYKVPTFGRIMKIIDFGRATFRPPPASAKAITPNHVWFSDAFAPHADAGGQYNCGPYFEQGKPKVKPNPSFDLCRLAVSILDTLWPTELELVTPNKVLTREPGRIQHETKSPLWNLLWLWLTDKNGKNILYSPDGSERYPQFDLYCAIAKDAQNAVPAQQLTLPLFDSAFKCRKKDIPADAPIWKLAARI